MGLSPCWEEFGRSGRALPVRGDPATASRGRDDPPRLAGRRGTAQAGCRGAGRGSAGRGPRGPAEMSPSGPGGLRSGSPASSVSRGCTGRASRARRGRAAARPGSRGCHPSAIQVLWLWRRPWGVSLSLTGSQQARGTSSAGGSPPPGQCSLPVLWAMTVPSRRSLTERPHDGQFPMPSVLTSRSVPRPAGGMNGRPGTATASPPPAACPTWPAGSAPTRAPSPPPSFWLPGIASPQQSPASPTTPAVRHDLILLGFWPSVISSSVHVMVG
jgi:hypothetical protein